MIEIGFALFGLAIGLILGFGIGHGTGYKQRVKDEDACIAEFDDDVVCEKCRGKIYCTCHETEPGIELEHASIDKDNGINLRLRHPKFAMLGDAIGEIMRETGAENFLTLNMCDATNTYEVTCRKADGKTPADRIAELELELKRQMNDYLEATHDTGIRHDAKVKELLKEKLQAQAAVENILNTLDHPHDHAYSEIEGIAREWEKTRK